MAAKPTLNPSMEQTAFLAAIGHICLYWALLEQTILFVISAIENVPVKKAYVVFAHLDMKARINMAILLAQDAGLPHQRFIRPLMDIRKQLDKDGSKLADRRNMFVHGAHKMGQSDGEYVLTMSRWKGDKREHTVTLVDASQLALELWVQAQKADAIYCDYGVWKFGSDPKEHGDEQIAKAKATLRLIRAYNIKRALKLLFANFKPL